MRIFLLLLCLLTETVQFRLASSFDIAGFRVRCTNNLRSGINSQLLNPNRPTSAFQSCNKGQVVEHRTTLRPLFLSVDNIDSPKKGKAYKDAIKQTTATVLAAASFAAFLGYFEGYNAFVEFSAGYLVEQSLSVDNLFVFLLLFEYFKVPFAFQNKILNWGIIGAMVMRAVMIAAGAVALKDFHGILLVFAGILVFSSGKILTEFLDGFLEGEGEEEEENLENNWIVKFSNSIFKSTDKYDGDNFFTVNEIGERLATPMLLCMIAVEISDVVFAVDSIPAVFGVTENPLIVFSSNIFAIAGLRSLYTILSEAVKDLKYLEPSVALVLGFIGAKMIAEYFGICIPTLTSLGVVAAFLGAGVGASVVFGAEQEEGRGGVGGTEGGGGGRGGGGALTGGDGEVSAKEGGVGDKRT